MIRSRIIAFLALVVFAGFLAIVVFKIKRADFAIVSLIGLGLVSYDLWQQLLRRRRR